VVNVAHSKNLSGTVAEGPKGAISGGNIPTMLTNVPLISTKWATKEIKENGLKIGGKTIKN
jgi:hypothetical protein